MSLQVFRVRSGAVSRPRPLPPFVPAMWLVAVSLLLPGRVWGDMFQTVGPRTYGDDKHSASLHPYPPTPVSTIASNPPGQCAWINAGLAAFLAANPADGSGPSGQAWTFNWAGVADEAKVEAGIRILDYYPYVVRPPRISLANGRAIPAGAKGELGGAVLNLKYTPQPGAPAIDNLHWIQAYTGTRRGAAVPPLLDNDPAHPFTGQSGLTPFYDSAGFAAGTLAGGGGWFADRPLIRENEYELDPVASIEFQVVLASDTQSEVGGITQNKVTLYGGEWWGFTYTAADTPEPASCVLLTLGAGVLFVFRVRRQRSGVKGADLDD